MFIRYEVICFSRQGKTWFSVKDFQTEEVEVLSFEEWLARADYYRNNGGLVFGHLTREDNDGEEEA